MKKIIIAVSVSVVAMAGYAFSQSIVQAPPVAQIQVAPTDLQGQLASVVVPPAVLTQIGTVKIRSAAEMIAAGINSPFSIGTETTDRNFSAYENWKTYVGPLGMAKARVQSGWADIERTPGGREYTKLKALVSGLKSQSIQPWMDLVYGNPAQFYQDGQFNGLGSPFPRSPESRVAWIKFVKDTVAEFNTPELKVTEWQIWNEPDSSPARTAAEYAVFAVETAKAIKSVQPEAKILLGGFTSYTQLAYIQEVMDYFDANKGPSIFATDVQVVYHDYQPNPDDTYKVTVFKNFRDAVSAKGYTIRQGENGAPSQNQPEFALKNIDWTEDAQAKYDLRRMLGDFYIGTPTNLFTLTDLHYSASKNYKGLLKTGTHLPNVLPTYGDQSVKGTKVAYRAIQAMTAIFDNRLTAIESPNCTVPAGYTVHAYTRLDPGNIRRNMLVVWRNTARPGVNEATVNINITCTAFNFPRFASITTLRPRYTDLLTAKVYQLNQASTVVQSGTGVTITALPVYDSPVVLSDQGIVLF